MIVPGSRRPSRLHSMFTASHQCTIASRAKLLGRAACVLLFSYSFLAISVWGADAPLPFSYTQRLWQMQDGLPEQVVQANSAIASADIVALAQADALSDHSIFRGALTFNNILLWPDT